MLFDNRAYSLAMDKAHTGVGIVVANYVDYKESGTGNTVLVLWDCASDKRLCEYNVRWLNSGVISKIEMHKNAVT